MNEQQRLLADAVKRILSEPFTVRELVILSPYAREGSTACQALARQATDARLTSRLGTSIDEPTRIRWGSIREFKGLEAPAVILTDVDLSKEYHRDLLYVGGVAGDGPACRTRERKHIDVGRRVQRWQPWSTAASCRGTSQVPTRMEMLSILPKYWRVRS